MTETRRNARTPAWVPGVDVSRPHLIGCDGVGMSALAELYAGADRTFTGWDRKRTTARPALGTATCAVVSSAIDVEDAEVLRARAAGLPVIHRAQALAELMRDRTSVAVTGTHGKTTTSAMLAHILAETGQDPAFALGGRLIGAGNARTGRGPMVVEADESDRSLLLMSPRIAVITSVDDDHPETLNGLGDTLTLFEGFVRRLPVTGTVVICSDDPGAALLMERLRGPISPRVVTYGSSPTASTDIRSLMLRRGNSHTVARVGGQQVEIYLPFPGRQLALDAVAAVTTAHLLGVPPDEAARALATYPGVHRRLTLHGNHHGVAVVDSFAHHPTAITADLAAARTIASPRGRIWIAFEPSGAVRVEHFGPQIGRALASSAGVLLLPLHSQFTASGPEALTEIRNELRDHHVPVWDAHDAPDEGTQLLADRARQGDVILTMGTGGVTELGPQLCSLLGDLALAS
ncbi:UDP-N-acetylmuramate--L-alanine ligase [Actinomadura rupiterrae]|uniref:UDP-N-acetylmuramate--L-alanine ligase n=1 Tax=Actinomadura rupiterrae TaxID=559627 RepID=UPI0020A485CB|nr:Mur ligase family protein [Actinomadura rupiterrae]MCP2337947.1 UDP-N-acetylmuramate--alanine ligase [Actinomadura rupiterrae]